MSSVHGVAKSAYELAREQKIEENKEMMKKLFGENQHEVCSPVAVAKTLSSPTPAVRKTPRGTRKPVVRLPPRRNPTRHARSYHSSDVEDDDVDDALSCDSESTSSSTRLVVRWIGPLTKKRRTDGSMSSTSSQSTLPDSPPRKRKFQAERVIRPASDFSEEELLLVADTVSEKHYDREFGTSCHQCRQKTDDLKTICRDEACLGVRGQFCGPCLRNRYGESVRDALLDDNWTCPPCRGICNCSFCMPKRGRRCTGQLIGVARSNGYQDVKSFLGD